MLVKDVVIAVISILETGQLEIREDTVVYEIDDKTEERIAELSRTYHRTTINPGDDVDGKPQRIQDVTKAIWTPEVIANWKVMMKEREPGGKFGPDIPTASVPAGAIPPPGRESRNTIQTGATDTTTPRTSRPDGARDNET